MIKFGHIAQAASTVIFVGSSLGFALHTRPQALLRELDSPVATLTLLSPTLPGPQSALILPQLYLAPENPVMWALLIVLWGLLAQDVVGQILDPSDNYTLAAITTHHAIWPYLSLALICGAVWPWMVASDALPVVLGALFMMGATVIAAVRARKQLRPAIGFLAGWSTAICVAAVAAWIATELNLSMPMAAALMILPGAMIGTAAQDSIGQSIAYSAALIWAFFAIAVTTMGTSPITALAAIFGITAMAIVLIRAAS
jgi:small basic protein